MSVFELFENNRCVCVWFHLNTSRIFILWVLWLKHKYGNNRCAMKTFLIIKYTCMEEEDHTFNISLTSSGYYQNSLQRIV